MKTLKQLPELLKQRRLQLDLSQKDMLMRIGMSQQQYQRIEAGGDPRLSTLLRILEGMDLELILVPLKQVAKVEEILHSPFDGSNKPADENADRGHNEWQDILRDLED
ncbi:helix-turn-helix domain-containing protein [Rahnella aquatilis]|uniref:Putative transcriptional regulator with C-terminal CBS domains n=1 Tax=Rahnella aquatilis (strain ATCC 33071 / DSM 4594 / JCM 1683 / NBRC 105701 / NCIMB 13365 / CIP 78.65) TaxID=745277 RepID=H2IS03_RAHAC|nr:helix-turn-helix domain-containing protein [Rahnella aquatilis]AEX53709.1 putative transcriptional regulator with C-terminal CBS domains [Rahnella aquatilis CIP 78.65 = ATCC 33071]KFD02989.1 hypothetical protein GRAQ_02934 [Rahnella aquatilis CIP 78.65 = ATCC 33071]